MTDKSIPIMLRATPEDQDMIQSIKEYMERTLPGIDISQADVLRYAMTTTLDKIESDN